MELFDRFARYTERLGVINKYAARLGAYAVLHSMFEIELGNPIVGGTQTILGATLLVVATNKDSTLDI